MVTVRTFKRGDVVRDSYLHLKWIVVGTSDRGDLRIRRNGITMTLPEWEVELVASPASRTSKDPSGD